MKWWNIYVTLSIPGTAFGRHHPGSLATWSWRRSREQMGQPGGNWTQAPSSVNIPFWGEKTHFHTEIVFGMTHFVDWMWCVLSRIIIPDPASTIMKPAVKPSTRYCWFTFKDNLYTRIHSSDTGFYQVFLKRIYEFLLSSFRMKMIWVKYWACNMW